MLSRTRAERGDTLIEVLLALAVMAMVITVSLRTMNDGFSKLMVSAQRSETQALIYGQMALIRAAHTKAEESTSTAGDWTKILTAVAPVGTVANANGCTAIAGSKFWFTTPVGAGSNWTDATVSINFTQTTSSLSYPVPGNGLWVEFIKKDTDNNAGTKNDNYYEFYVKACWNGPGSSTTKQQIKSVMRLYEI